MRLTVLTALLAVLALTSCASVAEKDVTDLVTASQARSDEFAGLAEAFMAVANTVPDDSKKQILTNRISTAAGHYRRMAMAMEGALRKLGDVDYEALYQRLEEVGGDVWTRLSDGGN